MTLTPSAPTTAPIPTAPSRWRPYPTYRPSGVDWLSDVPAHWEVRRLTHLAGYLSRGESPDYVYEGGIAVINQACVQWDGLHLENVKFCRERDVSMSKALLRLGDIVINSTGTGTLGRCCVIDTEQVLLADSHVTIVRPMPAAATPKYLAYLLATQLYQGCIYANLVSGSTNQIELSREGLRALPVLAPPLPEQRAIAAFLDRETTRIDRLIAQKERLIALLHEQRAALISQVVTQGLDPAVPMRHSGVPWVGEIPAHWRVKRLAHLTDQARPIMYGIVLPGPNVPDGVPIVKGGDVDTERLKAEFLKRTEPDIDAAHARSRLRGRDVVYAIRGSIGACALVPPELEGANLTQDAARIAPGDGVAVQWLLYVLKSAPVFAQLEAGAQGATIRGINIRDLKRAVVPVPTASEQAAIARYLDAASARYNLVVGRVQEHMQKLREYRTALIAAAVTGRIDVRGEVDANEEAAAADGGMA